MYYEDVSPRRHKRPKKKKSFSGFLLGLLVRLMALVAIAAILIYALPVNLFITDTGGEMNPSTGLDTDMINILLLGVDVLNSGSQRSDTIIIASVGYNTLKLTSVMRDTIVDIPGHGRQKVNAAYAYGGPELTARTLNENFGLNITKYAVVDFVALADVINALGGVDISVSEAEVNEINVLLVDSWKKAFHKLGYDPNQTRLLELDFSGADEKGRMTVHLDGFQALAYARIRSLDSDYTRTSRQRRVLSAAMQKFRSTWYNPFMISDLAKAALSRVDTNMNLLEIMSIGSKAVMCGDIEQLRLPADGTYNDDGSALKDIDYAKNLAVFKEFVYGD